MNWDFTANTSVELERNMRPALCKGVHPETVAFERLHMVRLLEDLAETSILRYPISLRHTSERVPDFQLSIGGRPVAAELTRIKFQALECARALQHKRQSLGTLAVSRLLPKPGQRKPRKVPDLIQEGFGNPPMLFPSPVQEAEGVWLAEARKSLDRKTAVISRSDFVHGDEDWLILVDPTGLLSDTETRRCRFSELLVEYWRKPRWFKRVFLQDYYFEWEMAFAQNESLVLPSTPKEPPKEVLERDFQIVGSDASLFEP